MTPTPSSSPTSRRRQAAAAATARRKLAKRALHVGNVLLLLVAADWVLQQPGIEAHRVHRNVPANEGLFAHVSTACGQQAAAVVASRSPLAGPHASERGVFESTALHDPAVGR